MYGSLGVKELIISFFLRHAPFPSAALESTAHE
jgi:hypothetical protein